MEMFRHDYHGDDIKRMTLLYLAARFPQDIDLLSQKSAASIGKVDGEEPRAALGYGATISHGINYIGRLVQSEAKPNVAGLGKRT